MFTIIFDLDNTLTHRGQTLEKYSRVFVEGFSAQLTGSCGASELSRYIAELDAHGYVDHTVRSEGIRKLNIWHEPPAVSALIDHWQAWVPQNPEPIDGLHETLAMLKTHGYTLGMITNGSVKAQSAKIDALRIRHYFDAILISEQCGVAKPRREIFDMALEALGTTASNSVYIGDHPVNDFAGAVDAGLHAIWLEGFMPWPDNAPPASYQAKSLGEAVRMALQFDLYPKQQN